MLFVTCRLEEGYVVYDYARMESYLLDGDKLAKYARHGQCINVRSGVHTKLIFLSGCTFDNIVNKENVAGKQYVVCYASDDSGNIIGVNLLMAEDAFTWKEKFMQVGEVVCIHEQMRNFENIKVKNGYIKASHGNLFKYADKELRSAGTDKLKNGIAMGLTVVGLGLLGGVMVYAVAGGTPGLGQEKQKPKFIQEFKSNTDINATPLSVSQELEIEEVAGLIGNMADIRSYVILADQDGTLNIKDKRVYVGNKKLGTIDYAIDNHKAICSLHCICSFDRDLKGSSLMHDNIQLNYKVDLLGNTVYTLNLGGTEYVVTNDSVKSGEEVVYRKIELNDSGYTIERAGERGELNIVEAAVMMEQADINTDYVRRELLKME